MRKKTTHEPIPAGHKLCLRCEYVLPLASFGKWSRSKDGRQGWCKPCRSAYQASPEQRPKELLRMREWRQEHLEQHTAGVKKWQAANPEKVRHIVRESMKRNYPKYKHRMIDYNHRRRSLHQRGSVTPEQWADRLLEFNYACAYCLKVLAPGSIQQEHMHPLSRDGEHTIENLVPACRECNSSKGTKTLLEFCAYQNDLSIPSVFQAVA